MNETNTTELCSEARKIFTGHLRVIFILECVLCPFAVLFNGLALYLLWRIQIFHPNIRLLLCNLSMDLALYPISLAVKSVQFLTMPVCDLAVTAKRCVLQDWAITVPLHNSLTCLAVLSVERLWATVFYRTYDNSAKSKPYLAGVLIMCSWFGTWYIQVYNMLAPPAGLLAAVCEPPMYGGLDWKVTVAFLVLESAACSITLYVYGHNYFLCRSIAINRAKFDLTSRFQVSQNLKLSAALLPSDLLHVVCYVPSYAVLFFTTFPLSFTTPTKMWFVHMTYLYRMMYACLHPLLLVKQHPNIRKAFMDTFFGYLVKRCWVLLRGVKVSDDADTQGRMNAHFNHLETFWSQTTPQRGAQEAWKT